MPIIIIFDNLLFHPSQKQHELNKNKEIIVLDPKRSNAINIGMTKLPPPRSIKTAILKMDSTVMNREGIEVRKTHTHHHHGVFIIVRYLIITVFVPSQKKLLTMLPTEEERSKIQEAQSANPELPLGTAEHFLLTLASISELTARLKLWAFKLNYDNIEKVRIYSFFSSINKIFRPAFFNIFFLAYFRK